MKGSLRKQFALTKETLGFNATFEEINGISYIEDMALSQGYVSNNFSRQMINRMLDTFSSWLGQIHSWIYPQPNDMIHGYESKKVSEEERKELLLMVDRIMYLLRKHKRIAFKGLIKEEEAAFVDELVDFDKEYFNPFMLKYHEKFESVWESETMKAADDSEVS